MTKEQKILLLFVLLAIGGGVTVYVSTQKSTSVSQVSVTTSEAQSVKSPTTTPQEVKVPVKQVLPVQPASVVQSNTTYTETVSYSAPNNNTEQITVTVILDSKGKIVDAVFSNDEASNKESKQYLAQFAKTFTASMVVGQNINSASLSRVAGASLTTKAFNKAIANIGVKVNG
jgi:hypothetical protein